MHRCAASGRGPYHRWLAPPALTADGARSYGRSTQTTVRTILDQTRPDRHVSWGPGQTTGDQMLGGSSHRRSRSTIQPAASVGEGEALSNSGRGHYWTPLTVLIGRPEGNLTGEPRIPRTTRLHWAVLTCRLWVFGGRP